MKPFASVVCLFLSVSAGMVRADDASVDNLTVASSAFFGGVTSFGYADGGAGGAGFSVDVFSGVSQVLHEEVIPGHYTTETTFEDVWGWVPGDPQSVWVEDYGSITEQVWVDEYGQVEVITWVPDEFDIDGNLLVPGHNVSTWEYGIAGGHFDDVPGWGVVGGHYETVDGEPVWVVVDTVQQVTETWVPEEHNTTTETVYGLPVIRQIGKTADTVWKWKNLDRELMELSAAGLSIPLEGDTSGAHKAVFTSTAVEQSYTTPAGSAGYLSYGVKMQKDGVEAWQDTGANDVVQMSQTLKLKADEVVLREATPVPGTNSAETRTTRVGVNSSRFGGLVEVAGDVKVQGVLRVRPQGDLLMGAYTNGPQP
jgi:hypothetical protein